MKPRIHFAKMENSRRLQEVHRILADGHWHSGLSISKITNSMATHTDIAEIRANGIRVEQRYNGKTPNGRRISEYRMETKPRQLALV